MSSGLLAQTVVAGLMAAALLLAFAVRFAPDHGWMAAALATVAADHATKGLAHLTLRDGGCLELLGGRLVVAYDSNPMQGFGAAFAGILGVTVVIVILAAALYRGLAERGYRMARISSVACGLMAGGFAAIAADRALRGAVVDLVYFGPAGAYLYNIADFAVFAALVLLTLRLLQLAPEVWRRRHAIWRELTEGAQEAT